MCEKRASVLAYVKYPEPKAVRVDMCMRNLIEDLQRQGVKTVSACCGHNKYKKTIVIKTDGGFRDIFTRTLIPRTRNFYRKDKSGFFYIPEVHNAM